MHIGCGSEPSFPSRFELAVGDEYSFITKKACVIADCQVKLIETKKIFIFFSFNLLFVDEKIKKTCYTYICIE